LRVEERLNFSLLHGRFDLIQISSILRVRAAAAAGTGFASAVIFWRSVSERPWCVGSKEQRQVEPRIQQLGQHGGVQVLLRCSQLRREQPGNE
jgi:hypothetical protein